MTLLLESVLDRIGVDVSILSGVSLIPDDIDELLTSILVSDESFE